MGRGWAAMEMCLTGEPITAADAEKFGLVSREPYLQTPAAKDFATWLRQLTAASA